jgi:hypothetical protein
VPGGQPRAGVEACPDAEPTVGGLPVRPFSARRLEWHSATDQWRLYVDQKLLRGAFVTEVVFKWHPPKAQLVVRAEPQYRSDANIGLPALPRGD